MFVLLIIVQIILLFAQYLDIFKDARCHIHDLNLWKKNFLCLHKIVGYIFNSVSYGQAYRPYHNK